MDLRDLKLDPARRPLVACTQMYWKPGHIITTRSSLKISRKTEGPSGRCLHRESERRFEPKWRGTTGFPIPVLANTGKAGGSSPRLSVTWEFFHARRCRSVSWEHLAGTNDSTRHGVKTHAPRPPQIAAILILLQDDPGTPRFDHYRFEPLSEANCRKITANP